MEKVYAVWPNRGSRLTSTAYKVGLVALIGFLCLIVVFLVGEYDILGWDYGRWTNGLVPDRDMHIRDDGECLIGSSFLPFCLSILG